MLYHFYCGGRLFCTCRQVNHCIRITHPCDPYPLTPHFHIVKLGFTWVYIIFLIFALKHRYGCSLEPPHWGVSNVYPQSVLSKNKKTITFFQLKIIVFTSVKYRSILHRHVCVMVFCITWTQQYAHVIKSPSNY